MKSDDYQAILLDYQPRNGDIASLYVVGQKKPLLGEWHEGIVNHSELGDRIKVTHDRMTIPQLVPLKDLDGIVFFRKIPRNGNKATSDSE